jgi:hypothetical protein
MHSSLDKTKYVTSWNYNQLKQMEPSWESNAMARKIITHLTVFKLSQHQIMMITQQKLGTVH